MFTTQLMSWITGKTSQKEIGESSNKTEDHQQAVTLNILRSKVKTILLYQGDEKEWIEAKEKMCKIMLPDFMDMHKGLDADEVFNSVLEMPVFMLNLVLHLNNIKTQNESQNSWA